jgi:undecaprenyl-diphosphatase
MDFITSIVFGIIEGITEFLPISSTGHLILTAHVLKIPQSDFVKTFEIAIQLGAIMAVVWLYGKTLFTDLRVLKRVFVAFIPTALVGLALYPLIKRFLLGNSAVVVAALFLGGIFLILFELLHRERQNDIQAIANIPYDTALCIGLFQSIALIPGVSRAAATIIGGLALRLKRKAIVEFSFLLAVPTMCAAVGLDLLKSAKLFSHAQYGVLAVGFLTSFVVGVASIKFLLYFIKSHNFIYFGVYRIVVAVVFWYALL